MGVHDDDVEKNEAMVAPMNFDDDDADVDRQEEQAVVSLLKGKRLAFSERYNRFLVKRPLLLFVLGWVACLMIAGVVSVAGWFTIDDLTGFDWLVADSAESEYWDALDDARSNLDVATVKLPVRSEGVPITGIQVLLTNTRGTTVFTGKAVQAACDLYATVLEMSDYPKFCLTTNPDGENTICDVFTQRNLVALFYPTFQEQLDCALLSDQYVQEVVTNSSNGPDLIGFFVNKDYWITGSVQSKTRSELRLGGPLGADSTPNNKTYSDLTVGDDSEQGKIYGTFMDKVEEKLKEKYDLKKPFFGSAYGISYLDLGDGIQLRYNSIYFQNNEFKILVNSDQLLASASAMLVGVFVYIHVGSLFVTINTMFVVVMSIPLGLFVYSGIMGIGYFNSVHIVVIFLVLGIGADDLFVLSDAFVQSKTLWKQLRGMRDENDALERNLYGTNDQHMEILIARMTYAWKRAAVSVFNTSFTTFVAFVSTAISPVTPVAGFGIFAAICVLVLYLLTLTMMPLFILVDEKYFRGRPFCCACFRSPKAIDPEAKERPPRERPEDLVMSKWYVPCMKAKVAISSTKKVKLVAIISLLVMAGVFVSFAIQASNLSTPVEDDEPFDSSHMFTGFTKEFGTFSGGQQFSETAVVFGIKGIDRDGFKRFEPAGYRGKVIYDDNFELAPQVNQQYILDVCASLVDLPCKGLKGCLDTRVVTEVKCTLSDFHAWHDALFTTSVPALQLGDVNSTAFYERLFQYSVAEGKVFDIGFIGGELRFFIINYVTSLETFKPERVKGPVIDLMYEWYDSLPTPPAALASSFQTSIDMLWIVTERGIVEGMFDGLLISIPVGFAVLMLSSMNPALSFLGIFSICGILASVMGTIQVLGYSLGIGEAIAVVMAVGLSLDYVIHCGGMYSHASEVGIESRTQRFVYASHKMGGTILAATVTTAGSAVVMLFTTMSFFHIMGTLIMATMLFSFVFCFFFFLAMLILFGPERNQCQLNALCKKNK